MVAGLLSHSDLLPKHVCVFLLRSGPRAAGMCRPCPENDSPVASWPLALLPPCTLPFACSHADVMRCLGWVLCIYICTHICMHVCTPTHTLLLAIPLEPGFVLSIHRSLSRRTLQPRCSAVIHGRGGRRRQGHFDYDYGVDLLE